MFVFLSVINFIGQMTSSPLYLLLAHYLNVKTHAHNISVMIEMSKFITLFILEWAPYNVDWPSEGNFELANIKVIENCLQTVNGEPKPSILHSGLEGLAGGPPSWIESFFPGGSRGGASKVHFASMSSRPKRLTSTNQVQSFNSWLLSLGLADKEQEGGEKECLPRFIQLPNWRSSVETTWSRKSFSLPSEIPGVSTP